MFRILSDSSGFCWVLSDPIRYVFVFSRLFRIFSDFPSILPESLILLNLVGFSRTPSVFSDSFRFSRMPQIILNFFTHILLYSPILLGMFSYFLVLLCILSDSLAFLFFGFYQILCKFLDFSKFSCILSNPFRLFCSFLYSLGFIRILLDFLEFNTFFFRFFRVLPQSLRFASIFSYFLVLRILSDLSNCLEYSRIPSDSSEFFVVCRIFLDLLQFFRIHSDFCDFIWVFRIHPVSVTLSKILSDSLALFRIFLYSSFPHSVRFFRILLNFPEFSAILLDFFGFTWILSDFLACSFDFYDFIWVFQISSVSVGFS